MGRIIVLEGPDGSGKTTLARYLEQHHGFIYDHTGVPLPNEDLLVSYAFRLQAARESEKDIVFDRMALGESVYGPVMRNNDQLGQEGQIILQRIMRAAGAKQVLCLPPYSVCVKAWMARKANKGEYVVDTPKFHEVYYRYQMLAKSPWISPHLANWDYTEVRLEDAAAVLIADWTDKPQLPVDVIGHPQASFLFVGEIANQEYLDLPWIDLGQSSHYLNTALWDAEYDESEMAFTNVKRLDGSFRNISELALKCPNVRQVVALGKATSRFIGTRVPHKMVPHPAYWKRFHSSERSIYVKMLRDIRVANYAKHRVR